MKSWVYIGLLIFIGIAGYQFGYYHNQLSTSDIATEQLFERIPPAPQAATPEVENAHVQQTARLSTGPVASALRSWEASRDKLLEVRQNNDTSAVNLPGTEQKLREFFTLHPSAKQLLLHSVRCSLEGCELTGQFDGSSEELNMIVEPLKRTYSSLLSSTTQNSITHFVLQVGAQN